ncbi:MAG: hypothetical protein WCZ90_14055 [Melioribacteraceae bacterium]
MSHRFNSEEMLDRQSTAHFLLIKNHAGDLIAGIRQGVEDDWMDELK